MSTSDQQGKQPLTRKQLREIRLTGATPVISDDEAAAAAEANAEPAVPETSAPAPEAPAPAPRPDAEVNLDERPLTRRQVREQERIRTASVPVVDFDTSADQPSTDAPVDDAPVEEASVEETPVDESPIDEPAVEETPAEVVAEDDEPAVTVEAEEELEIVSEVPTFAAQAASDTDASDTDASDTDADDEGRADHDASADEDVADGEDTANDFESLVDADDSDDADSDEEEKVDDVDPIATGERPVVSSAFGKGVQADVPAFTPSFDELIASGSGGSQNHAANTLIFTPLPGRGSLSGPIASTGELLITGSYELPNGIGSQGHAHGAADGKDVDAVLIDGELPASSSPTPIAASSAVSTTKPAGEVIRPPAPEKGNKLMLTLAIMAGGLALALAVVLIVAFTMNLF